jgi:hypothetical protein
MPRTAVIPLLIAKNQQVMCHEEEKPLTYAVVNPSLITTGDRCSVISVSASQQSCNGLLSLAELLSIYMLVNESASVLWKSSELFIAY